jgi:TRAP-type uncharacterized transport system fused permease subunit
MERSVSQMSPPTIGAGVAAEPTSSRRDLKGVMRWVVATLAVLMSLFHLYTAGFGVLGDINQRAVHLMFAFALIFLGYAGSPRGRHRLAPGDVALALLGVVAAGYLVVNYEYVVSRELYITPILPLEWILAIATVLLVLEAARRTNGWPLPLVATAFLLYAFVGPYLPGLLQHRGVPAAKLVDQLYLTVEGIFGIALAVSATFVFLFILFGSFLEKSGTGEFFIELSKAMVGHMRGGPAKMAVMASCMFGTISGSAVANVVTTGFIATRLGLAAYIIPSCSSTGRPC